MSKSTHYSKRIFHIFLLTVFSIMAIIYILPLVITFTNSLMSMNEVSRHYSTIGDIFHPEGKFVDMAIIPEKITLSQYIHILLESPVYLNMFWNSVKIAVPIVVGQLFVSSMAAYAFTILQFKGKELLFFIYIIVMLLPLQVTLMPNYIVFDWLNMTDSYLAIILPGISNPFGVFLLRQFMKMIPSAYIESAQMDGAGHIRIFFSIVLPMIKSGLASVAMLTFVDYWNVVDQAVIFIQDTYAKPMSLFLARVNQEQMGVSFASSCFYIFPVLIILFYGQEYLKEGINLSGLKG
ncbi:carbohydrate ABC transporter permease [Tissierella carlieri]|uniref:carbohydrate ABC transporter permease n=1 Tax=Tissierella carlieri TaxID=689904 RepID=UPI001C0FC064|nr:carbohydrate ABC transporter permease [Tissierella carlieri]MBU5314053.1 carbohydrate ABC transporter permease [Tissierella carlieri]